MDFWIFNVFERLASGLAGAEAGGFGFEAAGARGAGMETFGMAIGFGTLAGVIFLGGRGFLAGAGRGGGARRACLAWPSNF